MYGQPVAAASGIGSAHRSTNVAGQSTWKPTNHSSEAPSSLPASANETPTTRLAHNFGKQIAIVSAEKSAASSKGKILPTVALNALADHAENEAEQEIAKGMQ